MKFRIVCGWYRLHVLTNIPEQRSGARSSLRSSEALSLIRIGIGSVMVSKSVLIEHVSRLTLNRFAEASLEWVQCSYEVIVERASAAVI